MSVQTFPFLLLPWPSTPTKIRNCEFHRYVQGQRGLTCGTSNDALRKHGILPPKPPTPRTPSPPPAPTLEEKYANYTAAQLREIAAEAPDDETERLLELIRRKKLQEARKMEMARFGRVYPISREDYTREVTEASKVNEEGDAIERGTGVVVFLYKDG